MTNIFTQIKYGDAVIYGPNQKHSLSRTLVSISKTMWKGIHTIT